MSSSGGGQSSGIGFVGLLTIAFVVLKLTKHIAWSWVWVLSPVWISAAAVLGIIGVGLLVILVVAAVQHFRGK